ncbi:tyrosine-type recombinase/integrase [Comamonas sp. MYb69]|uniref:tyrosine-type recombinase/integrase n=1 Tax=Comamonas sp. MYb69 TaxID=1848650 RepID=UPI003095BBE6
MTKSESSALTVTETPFKRVLAEELEFTVEHALNQFSIQAIQDLSRQEGTLLKSLLRHGNEFGKWATPKEWHPTGKDAYRNANIKKRILDFLHRYVKIEKISNSHNLWALIDNAELSIIRYLILCRMGPVGFRYSHGESLGPTKLAMMAYSHLPQIAALSISKALSLENNNAQLNSEATGCFKFFSYSLIDSFITSESIAKIIRIEIQRMHMLEEKGLWNDAPERTFNIKKTSKAKGASASPLPQNKINPHKPLPDNYVSQMGKRSLWIIEHLAPNILHILSDFQGLWKNAALAGQKRNHLGQMCKKYLANFNWTNAGGTPLENPGYEIRLTTHGKGRKGTGKKEKSNYTDQAADKEIWPPENMSHIFGLARIVQGAHYFISELATAARIGEALTLNRSCVVYSKDGTHQVEGRTFKLVKRVDGEFRTWSLPAIAATALEQQARLVALYERLSGSEKVINPETISPGTHLWGQVGGSVSVRSMPIQSDGLNALLVSFAKSLGMETCPGGQLLRTHRFRKTIARLAALALTNSPKILQDVFGHKSIEMTMYYILTDKDLTAEIEVIARELRIMRASEVVADMLEAEGVSTSDVDNGENNTANTRYGGYGGPAALRVHNAIQEQKKTIIRRGEDFNAANIRELGEVLTMQGKDWQAVRTGVICTKSAGQSGPCNKKKGKPEPSRCATNCDFRLEEAWHRQDVDECILQAVQTYQQETERGEDLVASLWAGQIRALVPRFQELQEKWMDDPTVQAVMNGELPL